MRNVRRPGRSSGGLKGNRGGPRGSGPRSSPYDRFMESQGVPVHRGPAMPMAQELELADWQRLGGRGAFIQLTGIEDLWGMYLAEIPAGGSLEVERHLYYETAYVLQGSGVTELWQPDDSSVQTFEWRDGSLFAIPLNWYHRICNGSSSEPALLLVGTTAPSSFNLYPDPDFVFGCPYSFARTRSTDHPGHEATGLGLPSLGTLVMPDILSAELPETAGEAAGRKFVQPDVAPEGFRQVLLEQPVGLYPPARTHQSGTVFICVSGTGYSYDWLSSVGERPWEMGEGDRVRRHTHRPASLISVAPTRESWFHQDFATGDESLRLLAWLGPHKWPARPAKPANVAGDRLAQLLPAADDSVTIPYANEDQRVRKNYMARLQRDGGRYAMAAELFDEATPGEAAER